MIIAKDLLNEVADRLGYPQITTLEVAELPAEHRKLLRLLNRVLESIGAFNDWPLLREEGTIVTVGQVQTDGDSDEYVTATQNSDTITVANYTSFDQTFIGRAVQVSGDEYVYRVKAVPANNQLQLNRAWVSASITASDEKTLDVGMDRYTLPANFDRAVDDWQGFFAPYDIKPVDPYVFRERRRDRPDMRFGDPEVFTIFGLQNSRQIVHFDPYPENARLLNFEYQKRHPKIDSDNDQILYPYSYLNALMDILLQLANRDYEDSGKMEVVLRDALRSHNLQQSNPGVTASRPRIAPSNRMRRTMRTAYGWPSNIDWGDAFDTGEIHGL